MLSLGVLVSGSGSNLQAIIDAISAGTLDARCAVVISNKPDVFALERAKKANIPTVVIPHKSYASREAFDGEVVRVLKQHAVDFVVLAGFMRLVTRTLLDEFPYKVVNVHPGLLPSFPGVDAPAQAIAKGVKIAGCTVHLVDSGVDTGPIIAQSAVSVLPNDTAETLHKRIQVQEHKLLPTVVQWFSRGWITLRKSDHGATIVDTTHCNEEQLQAQSLVVPTLKGIGE